MTKENVPTALGTESIGKLLMKYAIPAIIAMTAASLYNMIDSIFIGHGVGTLAISGLAATFPFMNLAAAFGSLVGAGAATLVSVKLGQRDYATAKSVLGNVVILNVLIGVVFTVVFLIFIDPVLFFFGASEATISYAREYMQIILLGNIITHVFLGLNSVLRSSGHPKNAMIATILTVVINTILDPIFIFVFDWGIRGAAIATIAAQAIVLVWLIIQFTNKNELIHFDRSIFRLKKNIVMASLSIGMSPFLMNLAATFVVKLINQGLKTYGGDMDVGAEASGIDGGDIAVGAYGIVNRLVFFFLMIVMGLNQGMQPIAGYNFGAKLYSRVTKVLKLTICAATVVTTLCFIIGMFFPGLAVSLFTSDPELIAIASRGFTYTVLIFPIVGFQIVTSNFFQSIGMAGKAIFLSLTRQVLFLIPSLLILPTILGEKGVWLSLPLSDLAACIASGILLWWQFKVFRRRTVLEAGG